MQRTYNDDYALAKTVIFESKLFRATFTLLNS